MYTTTQRIGLPIALCCLVSCFSPEEQSDTEWRQYGGGNENIRYSPLRQIDTANVHQLQPAWTYHTGDSSNTTRTQIQCNPIVVNGILYATSPQLKLFALDAATGEEKWVFNPHDPMDNPYWHGPAVNISRGVTYWEEGNDKRILFTAGSIVYAVNALTGQLISDFGEQGGFDLHHELDRDDVHHLHIAPTSPGIIYKDLYIIGGRVSEDQHAAPGHIRAFDVKTGTRKWIFHTIPQPGQPGYETWQDTAAYRYIGGANNWSGFSLDEQRGILYVPTGSASFDFYGGKRKGDNLFANCLIALNAATGQRIWHFQFVHHDVWDRDVPTPPALVTLRKNGKTIDAVAQPTKQGFVYVFDRVTGEPVYPIEERPVPEDSPLTGEALSPTQPFPVSPAPFVRQIFREEDINDLVPDSSHEDIRRKLALYRNGHMFQPPSREGTVIFPGFDGGAEWGGPAFDPATGILYINANEMPWVLTMVDAPKKPAQRETYFEAGKRLYMNHCMNCHGPDRKGAGNFPPLTAVNEKYTSLQFDTLLRIGRRMMPGFQYLTNEERNAVALFVLEQTEGTTRTFQPPEKPINEYLTLPYSFTGYHKFETSEGYPAVKPPWGTLNALNLNTGEYEWKVPLGEFKELTEKGIPPTGTENYGGPVVTAGGLVFIAASRDEKIRAFNKRDGTLLWEYQLPFAGYATPSVYMRNGKQYLVIACGGGKLNTRSGDAYLAFALP